MLIDSSLLSEPIIYPSYYFKKHRLEYYQQLDRVRTHGDFEGWISFYLTAIRNSSIDAYQRTKDIETLESNLIQHIKEKCVTSCETRLNALSALFSYPAITISELASQLEIAYNTAHQIISDFVDLAILVEQTKQKRGKIFTFEPYLAILQREYDE